MPLKARDQVKTVFGNNPFSLQARPGQSLLVKDIKSYCMDAMWITLKIEKTSVGYFKVFTDAYNHLPWPTIKDWDGAVLNTQTKTILNLLTELGLFKGYPVAQGETFILQKNLGNASDVLAVIYDVYDAEDQKPTDPNGSKSNEYLLINYGDTGAQIVAAGDHLYDHAQTPIEFPQFPFAAVVPGKHQITIHGILANDIVVRNATPATAIYTKYLKLVKDREVLFDEDRNGIPHYGAAATAPPGTYRGTGYSLIGDFSNRNPKLPLLFTEPLVFDSGDELNIFLTVEEPVDGSAIPQLDTVIGIIQTIKRITG